VGKAEQHLRVLMQDMGWQWDIRVRSMGDIAKIEIPREQIPNFILNSDMQKLTTAFRKFGFSTITLDLEGFRSGKLNDFVSLPEISSVASNVSS
jgi:pyridinium-3,5-biscarboxylic acid mononucleotide sulfurtransferase